ncbi:MAG: hypothetical protein RMJ56_07960 [Gemmataceae bacterium]|nr:hypothetical protein [Gemmata sp.]MDW8197526.1 hypothetical protein [Gemmataceae bacterium]
MDGLRELLEAARANGLVTGHFRGLLHIAIGRRVTKTDGTKVSDGMTWRPLAALLKAMRFDPQWGREVGADPNTLSPRDRERYWYAVIAMAGVDSPQAVAEAEKLAEALKPLGYLVGPPPGGLRATQAPSAKDAPPATPSPGEEATEKPKKKKK